MHLPISKQTEHELWSLASVQSQILSPKDASPIVAVVQDVLLGVHRITKDGVALSNKQFMNIICNTSKFMGDVYNYPYNKIHTENLLKEDLRSGHELLSYIMPKHINITLNNNSYNEDKEDNERLNKVIIENGIIKQGTFDKGIYQKHTRGLVHTIYNEYGQEVTADLFDDTQKLVCNWLVYSGFSVGIGDLMVKPDVQKQMNEELRKIDEAANALIVKLHYGQIENNSIGLNDNENFEAEMMKVLNKGMSATEKIGLKMIDADKDNRLMNMINGGSKGSKANVKQIISCLGQQDIEGKRVGYGFDDRTLPHYRRFDDSTHSRGFIRNSFIKGLSPQEFFFHAIAGRNGLIDTAVRSCSADTSVKLHLQGRNLQTKIGEWIDNLMEKHSTNIVNYGPEQFNMELLDIEILGYDVLIPTGDEYGNISYEKLTKITRHDPTKDLYKIKTASGRTVTAVDTESFIVWDIEQEKFVPIKSSLLEVGKHKLPKSLTIKIPDSLIVNEFKFDKYVSKSDVLYGSELIKGREFYYSNTELNEKDKILEILNTFEYPDIQPGTLKSKILNQNYKNGYIYNSATISKSEPMRIPDKFDMNYENGKMFGIYVADGCSDIKANSVRICNKNKNIQAFVRQWFDNLNIYGKVSKKQNQKSETYRFYSKPMAVLFTKMFSHLAKNKVIPEDFLYGSDDFVKGFLSGYLSCDCCYDYSTGVISHTASPNIALNITFMLNRFGIHTTHSIQTKKREEHHSDRNDIRIPIKYYSKLSEIIEIMDEDKELAFAEILYKNSKDNGGKDYCYEQYEEINDILLDEIVDITTLPSNGEKVYDVTVPSTLNFMLANGLVIRDTSEVGYLQRKLIKAMEDAKINHDLTVRDALGNIVQYLYGEDGINSIKYEQQVVPYIELSPQQMEDEYLLSYKDEKLLSSILTNEAFEEFDKADNKFDKCIEFYEQITEDKRDLIVNVFRREYQKTLFYPISLSKLVNNTKILFKTNEIKRKSDLNPLYIIEQLEKLEDELKLTDLNNANKNMGCLLRAYLSPKQLIKKYNFDKKIFNYMIDKIKIQFKKAIAHPSEMVGIVSAQSIGEPITQLTLNTFHHAGSSGGGHQTVRGVPRIKEIFSFSHSIKTPSMYIYLIDDFKTNLQVAEEVKNRIELTYMKQIVKSSKIYYCPKSQIKNMEGYDDFMQMFELYEEYKTGDYTELSPWFVAFEFDKKKMFDLQIHMIDIEYALSEKLKENTKFKLMYVLSDENADKLALRINILPEKIENDNIEGELKLLHSHISELLIKGIKGIKKIALTKKDFMEYNDDTNTFEKAYEWVLQTDGINMEEILAMNQIDASRLYCNDINIMNEIFGIEVAKQSFITELHDCLSSTDVGNKHISLLADIITAKGTLVSIDRHGINKSDIGPLAKCSFEETSTMLVNAGIFGEYDNMIGVSANMMLGQIPKCGTGDTKILIDEKKLHLLNIKEQNTISNDEGINDIVIDDAFKDEFFSVMEIKDSKAPIEMEKFA